MNNYVPRNSATILKNVISISANGANTGATFYQNKEFTVLQDAYALDWCYTDKKLSDNQYLFITGAISKAIYGNFEWTKKAGWERIKTEKIQLPIKNGEIDFEFMEFFVAELEAQRVAELEAYLSVTGLKDYELTEEEIDILNNVENLNSEKFKISELFNVETSKKRFDANKVSISENNGFPYVVRTALNNGVKGYIDEDKRFLNDSNTISFGQDTATMFYQKDKYFTGDKIKILSCKNENFNRLRALYFITSMSKSFKTFSWGASSFNVNVIKSQYITVPVTNKKIDYFTMELLISAIQKLVIKDVVKYTDSKINVTKQIIND